MTGFDYSSAVRKIGPSWKLDDSGQFILPEHTLGYQAIAWVERYLLHKGKPFDLTPEQRRLILWWYAIDTSGAFLYRSGVLQRIKGAGKDPFAAVLAAVEFVGPCRFAGWRVTPVDIEETRLTGLVQWGPIAVDNPEAWIVITAVSEAQTTNTMGLFPGLFSDELKSISAMRTDSIGKTVVYAHGGRRKIVAVTSNPATLEGNRPSFTIMGETHHWLEANRGHAMARVLEDNSTKGAGGANRTLAITNAYSKSEDSVAQRTREAWEAAQDGRAIDTGVFYDSLELAETTPLYPDDLPRDDDVAREAMIREHLARLIALVRGDATWLPIPNIVNRILDGSNSAADARRFWFNSIVAAEDAWALPGAVDAAEDPLVRAARREHPDVLRAGWAPVGATEEIVIAGDMSKNDDDTGLIGCVLSTGYVFTIGHWGKPPGVDSAGWQVPRAAVDARVDEAMERFNVVAFYVDPSHTQDDDASSYWQATLDGWHRRYKDKLQHWSTKTGESQHSIIWDMQSPEHQKLFAAASETFVEELETEGDIAGTFAAPFTHDGNPMLKAHMKNAKEYPTRFGISLWKGGRTSKKKIDLAVCAVMARMLRRIVLNKGLDEAKNGGAYWGSGGIGGWQQSQALADLDLRR